MDSDAINDSMRQLILRNLEDDLVLKLKQRAAAHGVSAEEEHRRILRRALAEPDEPLPDLKALLFAMPPGGDDSDFERLPDLPRDVDLS